MKFTHDELLNAVRIAGESGEVFTCGAVRDCLGVKSPDRETLNLFHRRFRTFQKEASDEIERVGKNAYRLKMGKRARARREATGSVIAAVKRAEGLDAPVQAATQAPAAPNAAAAALGAPQPEITAAEIADTEPIGLDADEIVELEAAPQPERAAVELETLRAETEADTEPQSAPPVLQHDAIIVEAPLAAAPPAAAPLQFIQVEDTDLPDPTVPESQPETLESLAEKGPATRSWRERWLGKRFAEFFSRA